MDRDKALELLREYVKDKSLLFHALETEAVMRGIANQFNEDEKLWGIVGLLHDIDYAMTRDNPEKHGIYAVEKILNNKLPEDALHAIAAHNMEYTGVNPETNLDFALRCSETVTGIIRANALVRPNKMKGMKPKSVKKKMKDKSFAANVSRDRIMECEKIGLDLNEFLKIAINEISKIANEVELV